MKVRPRVDNAGVGNGAAVVERLREGRTKKTWRELTIFMMA